MLRRVVLVVVLMLWPAGSLGLAALAAEMPGDTATIMLPKGDPEVGRATFLQFKCNTCHMVSGPHAAGMTLPVTTVPAPLLNSKVAQQEPGKLLTSIIAPSHTISKVVAEETHGELSPMGDFSQVMTVRQLVDLVAFLRTIEESPALKPTKRASSQ